VSVSVELLWVFHLRAAARLHRPSKLAHQLCQLVVGKGEVIRYRTAAIALSSLLGGHAESSLFWGFQCFWIGNLADGNWAWSSVTFANSLRSNGPAASLLPSSRCLDGSTVA